MASASNGMTSPQVSYPAIGQSPILKISSAYSPPPPEGFISPVTWGVGDNVIERFAAEEVPDEKTSFQRDTFTFNPPVRRRSCLPSSGPTTARR